jgi:signal transduction histidine kinase
MQERVSARFQISLLRQEESPLWYDVHAFPTAEGMAALVQDITELKLAEEALRKSEKLAATGRLAATISHEINNPLEAITNLLYLSLREEDLPERVRQYLVDADEELKRVASIVRQTLGFYRESKTLRMTNFSELVRAVLHLYRRRFETKHVRLITEFDMSLSAPIMDGEIKQVITNFVTNALDATEAGGVIHARVWEERGIANIAIEDNGSGISEESRERLFEPFFTTKVNVGTGLGLWISKEIVDKHGGTIDVETNTGGENHGTTFTLRIPLK